MFDIAWDELGLIAVVALIVIGPKDLPKVMRQAGRWARKAREMAAEFQHGVDELVRESELGDIKREVEKAADTTALRRQVEAAIDPGGEIAKGLAPPPPVDPAPPAIPVAPPAAEPVDPTYHPPQP